MKKIIFVLTVILLSTHSLFAQFKMSGKIRTLRPVNISIVDLSGKTIFNCLVESGKEIKSKKIELTPDLYMLKIGESDMLLPLENKEVVLKGFLNDKDLASSSLIFEGQTFISDYTKLLDYFKKAFIGVEQAKRPTVTDFVKQNESMDILLLAAIMYDKRSLFETEYDGYKYLLDNISAYNSTQLYGFVKQTVDKRSGYRIGGKFPQWTFENEKGEPVRLVDFKGKIVIMDFWASWCGPCRQEMKSLYKIYEEIKGDDLVFISISVDEDKNKWLNAALDEKIPWISLWDKAGFTNNPNKDSFGFRAIPYIVLLDKEGRTIARNLRGDKVREGVEELRKK